MLAPVRESYRTNRSLRWQRVYNVPGFAYFDHSAHIHKGIGCSSCHGRIDEMPLTFQVPSLLMEWCLDCHRHPERELRPLASVFDMHYEKPSNQLELGRELLKKHNIDDPTTLTSCTVCHR
jgi:cytochrome c553